jgi:hypothetical protein
MNYKIFAKTDENGNIIEIKTNPFAKGEGWTEIGTQEDRHVRIALQDTDGVYKYKLVNGVKKDKTSTAINQDKLKILKYKAVQQIKKKTYDLAIEQIKQSLKSEEQNLIDQINACTTLTQLKALKDER